MPLDDFFAKKEKKKAKKKQNPQDLIEKLAKDVEKLKEQDGEANSDATKPSVNLGVSCEENIFPWLLCRTTNGK